MDNIPINQNVPNIDDILQVNKNNFATCCFEVFQFQINNNLIYSAWAELTKAGEISKNAEINNKLLVELETGNQQSVTSIPFLPISFFKTHDVYAATSAPELVFTSSGTTGTTTSRHAVKSLEVYKKSFLAAFKLFYGDPTEWAIIGLLPSYLERQGSSLVMMTEELIKESNDADSGLYLYNFSELSAILKRREAAGKKTWLIGVTFALLDFAEQFPQPLKHTIVLETGGMKGRKKELTRMEVQGILKESFKLENVNSEYGMTELLSQAYSTKDGRFTCPPWMKVMVRSEDDPLQISEIGTGIICIIDLANIFSCSFICTEDLGKVYADGSFEIIGRMDNSDVRGCSQLFL